MVGLQVFAIVSTVLSVIGLAAFALDGKLPPMVAGLIIISLLSMLRILYKEYAG